MANDTLRLGTSPGELKQIIVHELPYKEGIFNQDKPDSNLDGGLVVTPGTRVRTWEGVIEFYKPGLLPADFHDHDSLRLLWRSSIVFYLVDEYDNPLDGGSPIPVLPLSPFTPTWLNPRERHGTVAFTFIELLT